jgi:hypothetical protein
MHSGPLTGVLISKFLALALGGASLYLEKRHLLHWYCIGRIIGMHEYSYESIRYIRAFRRCPWLISNPPASANRFMA